MDTPPGHSLDSFISSVLADGVKRMVYQAGLGYLAAGMIAVGIEFLGACIDRHAFNVDRQSKKRFQKGINGFMSKVNPLYRRFNRKNSRYYLYKQLRCGMAHIVRPHGKIAFVGRGDAQNAYSGRYRTPIPIHVGQGSDFIRTAFRFNPDKVPG